MKPFKDSCLVYFGMLIMTFTSCSLFQNSREVSTTTLKDKHDSDSTVFMVVEESPEFPGREEAMTEFISNEITYPNAAMKDGIEGKVVVNFIVEKNGAISNIHVLKGEHEALNNEAKQVVSKMPKWEPGTQKGERVRVKVNLPIRFTLSDTEEDKEDSNTIRLPYSTSNFPFFLLRW